MDSAPPTAQEIRDEEHLRLLAIFHFVLGGMEVFFGLFPVIHLLLGTGMMIAGAAANNRDEAIPLMIGGTLFVVLATVFMVAGLTLGGLTIYSGLGLQKRRRWTLSIVVAGLSCLWIPFGTILGVFTLLVLQRESVRRLYPS